MRTVVYCRKSSESDEKQVESLNDQRRELFDFLQRYNEWSRQDEGKLKHVETLEESASAKKAGTRKVFNEMILKARTGKYDCILIWDLSRLSRNIGDIASIIELLETSKIIKIRTPNQEFKNTPFDKYMLNQWVSNAKLENDQKGVNVTRRMNQKNEEGWLPGYPPLGYMNEKDALKGQKKILKDPERWEQVRKLWKLFLTGIYTVPQLIKISEEMGLKTRPTKQCPTGKFIPKSTLHAMFKNPFYYGQYFWNGKLIDGSHPTMISISEFQRAQMILSGDNPKARVRYIDDYKGILCCGECGGAITQDNITKRVKTTGEIKTYQYLKCSKTKPGIQCSQKMISVPQFEEQIKEIIESIRIPKELKYWFRDEFKIRHQQATKNHGRERKSIQDEINKNESYIENAEKKLFQGVIDDATYTKYINQYKQTRKELDERLQRYNKDKDIHLEKVESAISFSIHALESFQENTFTTKKVIISRLCSNWTLKDGKASIKLDFPLQHIEESLKKTIPLLSTFELADNRNSTTKNLLSEVLRPIWLPGLDSNQ